MLGQQPTCCTAAVIGVTDSVSRRVLHNVQADIVENGRPCCCPSSGTVQKAVLSQKAWQSRAGQADQSDWQAASVVTTTTELGCDHHICSA